MNPCPCYRKNHLISRNKTGYSKEWPPVQRENTKLSHESGIVNWAQSFVGPCWAHSRRLICWTLFGPGPGPIHLLGPGPCWGHSFVGPCWGHSFVGPCWAHLSRYPTNSHHCIEQSSYSVTKKFFNLTLALVSTPHKGSKTNFWEIGLARLDTYERYT